MGGDVPEATVAGDPAWAAFGPTIRKARQRHAETDPAAFSLRRVAERAGIEPTWLSRIERGLVPPPGEESIRRLAAVLDLDADVLLALAGKVSSDLRQVILQRPELFARLIREMKSLPDHAILRLVREVREGDW
jgi:transcriptional regulator with XRE-family HTH domain